MKQSGVIDKAIFSLYINLEEDASEMQLGGFDLNSYALPGARVSWHDCAADSYHWQLPLNSMTFVNDTNS